MMNAGTSVGSPEQNEIMSRVGLVLAATDQGWWAENVRHAWVELSEKG